MYGKSAFKGLSNTLKKEKPDAIVAGWPYVLSFLFDPFLLRTVRKNNIKLINRDIPFNIPKYSEAREFYREGKMMVEDLDKKRDHSFITTLKYNFVTWTRKWYFNLMDAHIFS